VLTLLAAGALSGFAIAHSIVTQRRFAKLVKNALVAFEEDELERRLTERLLRLEHGLTRRNVLALGRAALFGGTGCGVWELTGGSAHYLDAGIAFGIGLVGWMGTGEVYRRIGLLADVERRLAASRRLRQGVDQPAGTG
jgi:hypothetical protein